MKNNTSKTLIVLGLLLLIVPNFIGGALGLSGGTGVSTVFAILALIGLGLYLGGLAVVARARGHSAFWGATGLIFLVGGLIVRLLPDRSSKNSPANTAT